MNNIDHMIFKDLNNLDNMDYDELLGALTDLIYLIDEQSSPYPVDSPEFLRIFDSGRIVFNWFYLLKEAETEPNLMPKKDEILADVKREIIKEQSRRLKEIELSTKFLKGGMECTIQA